MHHSLIKLPAHVNRIAGNVEACTNAEAKQLIIVKILKIKIKYSRKLEHK